MTERRIPPDNEAEPRQTRKGVARRRTWPPFVGIAVLLVIAFPWYREADRPPVFWWGLPDWLVVAVCCFVGIAILNAYAWWRADWDDTTPERR